MPRTSTEIEVVDVATIVEDFSIYPRHAVDDVHVKQLVHALEAGAKLPPIKVERRGRRIVDGFHRARAHRRFSGDHAAIDVLWVSYPIDRYEEELLIDAVECNVGHGRRLSQFDIARCVSLFGELKIDPERMAQALQLTTKRISELEMRKIAVSATGVLRPIKATGRHLAGQTLTESQERGIDASSGMNQIFYINQVINLIESGILNQEDESVVARLSYLYSLIAERAIAA